MAVYLATIESMVTLVVQIETDGDRPTDDEILEAACYVENHMDSIIGFEHVTSCEMDE